MTWQKPYEAACSSNVLTAGADFFDPAALGMWSRGALAAQLAERYGGAGGLSAINSSCCNVVARASDPRFKLHPMPR